MDQKAFIKIGALWEQKGKNGTYFKGKLGDASLFIFRNKHKKTDKHPDWIMSVSEPPKKGAQPYNQNQQGYNNPPPQQQQQGYVDHTQGNNMPPGQWDAEDDGLPF